MPPPKPGSYIAKIKARNRRRAAQTGQPIGDILAGSGGGRTSSEAGLARSMAASGKKVSRSNRRKGRGQRSYRSPRKPFISSAVEAIASQDSTIARQENDARAAEMEANTRRARFARIANQEEKQRPVRRANRRVANATAEEAQRFTLRFPTFGGGFKMRPETRAQRQRDRERLRGAKKQQRRATTPAKTVERVITNTAVSRAVEFTNTPKDRKKNLPWITKALKTSAGRRQLVNATTASDIKTVDQQGVPSRMTGTVDPYEPSQVLGRRSKQQEELLRRKRQQIAALEKKFKRQVDNNNIAGARQTQQTYREQVRDYNSIVKKAQRLSRQSEQSANQITNQIAQGKWKGIVELKGRGANTEIEMPSETFQKDQVRQTMEEGLGLNLNPVDIGMTVGTGFIGRGLLLGGRAAVQGARAARAADDTLQLVPAAIQGLQSTGTKTGRLGGWALNMAAGPGGKWIRRASLVGTPIALVGGKEYTFPFVESAAQAVWNEPVKTGQTTFRNVLGGVAAIPVLGANLGASAKRAASAPFSEAEYKKEADYIYRPVTQLVDSTLQEMEQMWNIYTSKDVDRMARATAEDYGIGPVFSAYYLLRPFTKGIRKAAAQSGKLVTLPTWGTQSGFARFGFSKQTFAKSGVPEPGVKPRGLRITTAPLREDVYKLYRAGKDSDLATRVGFRNIFTNPTVERRLEAQRPDPRALLGRETINDIAARRALTASAFLMKSRSDAMVSTMTTRALAPWIRAVQSYNSKPNVARKAMDDIVDTFNQRYQDAVTQQGGAGDMPKTLNVPALVVALTSRGLDVDADGNLSLDESMIRMAQAGQEPGTPDAIKLEAVLALSKIFEDGSPERNLMADLIIGARQTDEILTAYRQQNLLERLGEGEELDAKLAADRHARELETVILYEQMTGKAAPSRPETAIGDLIDEIEKVLDDEELDLAQKKEALSRLSRQAKQARDAVYNRDLQDRARIRYSGLRGKLTHARKRVKKHLVRTRVAEATDWLVKSGGFKETIKARRREIQGAIASIEAARRRRDVRKGELKAREAEERRRKQSGKDALPSTRPMAERVLQDQIYDESVEADLLRSLRAEYEELGDQLKDIDRLEREVRVEQRLYESASKKVEKIQEQLLSRVNPDLRDKADTLSSEERQLREVVREMNEALLPFRQEVSAALTKEEYDAIIQSVDEEMAAWGNRAQVGRQMRKALRAKIKRLEAERNELDAQRPISDKDADALVARVADLEGRDATLRARLATILEALAEGGRNPRAQRDFEAAQEAMPDRPSGAPYKPGEVRTPKIEGRSQVVNELIGEIERNRAEITRLQDRLAKAPRKGEAPRSLGRQIDKRRAEIAAEIAAIHLRIGRKSPDDLPSGDAAKVSRAKKKAAIGVAVEEKRREVLRDEVEARQEIWDEYVEQAYRSGLGQALFITSRPEIMNAMIRTTGPEVDAGLRTPYEKFRSGSQIRSGDVNRGVDALVNQVYAEATAQGRERTSQGLMAQAYRIEDEDGTQQSEFTQEEVAAMIRNGDFDPDKWTWVPTTMLHDPSQFNRMIDSLMAGAERGKIDKYVQEEIDRQGAEAPTTVKVPSGEEQLVQKYLAEGGGVRGVLLPPQSIKVVVDSERTLSDVGKWIYFLNKAASRVVLGTSLSWALAQPIAEMLILVMDQPNPARLIRAAKTVNNLHKTEQGRRALSTLSGSTYGMSRSMRASDRTHEDYDRALAALNDTPIMDLVKEAARLETLGRFDRWKGAWIREIGVAAEFERELSGLRRASKAFLNQYDVIEQNNAKLMKMSPEERILWTQTAEGMAVGQKISKNIDDMMGNWTDVKPGLESAVGSLVFFYPFVRFSLRWTFLTYPKRHPVRAALAQLYGAANAEMLEEWLNFDPAWISDWAAAPVFGGTGDADGDGKEDRIVSLVGLNRVSPSGNAFIEYGALSENPAFTLTKILPPPIGMLGRAAFARDQYGAPLVDPNSPFGISELPGLGTISRQLADETVNLAAPLRSIIRYTGWQPSKIIERGDFPIKEGWGFLNDIPITFKNGLPVPKDPEDQDNRYEGQIERPAPGDDQNILRDTIRRELFALMPKPAHYYKTEQDIARLFDLRTAAEKDAQYPYRKIMYRGQLISLAEARDKIKAERKKATEVTFGMAKTWQPTKQQSNILKEAKDVERVRDNGERVKVIANKKIQDVYRDAGLPMGVENKIRQSVLAEKRQNEESVRREWEEKVSGEFWAPRKYPGQKKAKQQIQQVTQMDTEDGMAPVTGPVNGNGKFVAQGKATPRRKGLVGRLQAGSRARIKEIAQNMGFDNPRQVIDQLGYETDPTMDPATRVKKTKDGEVVIRYRGKKVLGRVPLEAVAKAERNNTLDVDENGRLTIPETRQTMARVEQIGERLAKQRRKLNDAKSKAGGVPRGVPKKYRASIRKWGAWLEDQMRQNGLILPYDQAVSDGNGVLPEGMSGAEYLAKVIQAESSWDESIGTKENTSYAGAMGLGQFIPGTRESILSTYGVDAYGDADQQIHAAAILLSKGGLENYNGAFPNSDDDPIKNGGYQYYLEQQVGDLIVAPGSQQKIKQEQQAVKALENQWKEARTMAQNMGIPVAENVGPGGKISWPAKEARQVNGAWAGTERLLDIANGGDFEISSEKRDYNTVSNGYSDHYTGATGSYAHDLPTTDDAVAEKMMRQYHNRLKLNEALEWGPGVYRPYTSRKYPGYQFQILWKSDEDHYDHVHIGARWTGEDLPAGTYAGGGSGFVGGAPSSGGGVSGGGAVASAGGAGGGGNAGGGNFPWQDADGRRLSLAESQSDMEPIFAAEQVAQVSEGETGQVESIDEAIASLPSVKERKKKSLRFDPKTRI